MPKTISCEQIAQAADYIRQHTTCQPTVGLVLGSGLGTLAEGVASPDVIPYQEIPHFVQSTVPGHSGRLVLGQLAGIQVFMMQGRVHYYEGYSAAQITLPIRVMRKMGVQTMVVTNAAGGIRQGFAPGDLMAIVDHINLPGMAGHNPLRGPNDDVLGPRFPDMSRAYDPELLALLRDAARELGIPLREGVYAMVAGPNFETPAEVRYLRTIGADAVGMSTVPEVLVARHGGMRVLGISLITNVAIDTLREGGQEPSHEEVLLAAQRAAPSLASLIMGVLQRLA